MKVLTESHDTDISRVLVIKELTPENANDLISAGFPFGIRKLYPPLSQNFLHATGLIPRVNRLVAYHTEEKRAIGFLCLMEDNTSVYSIKFVFVDPKFRKKGVASAMFNFVFHLAKNRGVKKVYLDIEKDWKGNAAKLYEKLGFQIIGTKMVGQGYLTNSSRLRVIFRTLIGQGYFSNFSYKGSGQLIRLQTDSKKSKALLFDLYHRCMDKRFLAFFDLNPDNIIYGYSQKWRHFCFRDVLTNKQVNSYALIFNLPSFSNASVEVNCILPANIPFILDDVVRVLDKKGMAYAHITLFNVCDPVCQRWFEDKGFELFHFSIMGITLE